MRIESFAVSMSSKNSTLKSYTKEETLRTWGTGGKPGSEGQDIAGQPPMAQLDRLELSDQAKAMAVQVKSQSNVARADETAAFEISDRDNRKYWVLQKCWKP